MEKLYTIKYSTLLDKMAGFDEEHNYKKFVLEKVLVKGKRMDVFFCHDERGMYAVAGECWKGGPSRTSGRWVSGTMYYDIYYRKNFRTKDEGNRFYRQVRATGKIA